MTDLAPTHAMVLAAGLGTRMRGHDHGLPKPLMAVAGRALIDRALDRLAEAGTEVCVVNLHYRAAVVRAHVEVRRARGLAPEIVFSDESGALLDTGGGAKAALPLLGEGPFFASNGDALWRDHGGNSFRRLARAWDDAAMDAMLLLHPLETAAGVSGAGDYVLRPDGRLKRARGDPAPYVFTGLSLLHPRLFVGAPHGAFSLIALFDRAESQGGLFGLVHEGDWMHVGTPEALAEAVAAWADGEGAP